MRIISALALTILFPIALSAQSAPPASPEFEIANVLLATRGGTMSFGGGNNGDGFTLMNATLMDLISAAYGVDGDKVVGGPAWLEMYRYDVIAKAPPNSSPELMRKMLQRLLAERFKLVAHADVRPVPAYLLTAGKGKPKLQESSGSGTPGCAPLKQNPPKDRCPINLFLATTSRWKPSRKTSRN
jgi:uncharacterized protein (TIGR03435 family)